MLITIFTEEMVLRSKSFSELVDALWFMLTNILDMELEEQLNTDLDDIIDS